MLDLFIIHSTIFLSVVNIHQPFVLYEKILSILVFICICTDLIKPSIIFVYLLVHALLKGKTVDSTSSFFDCFFTVQKIVPIPLLVALAINLLFEAPRRLHEQLFPISKKEDVRMILLLSFLTSLGLVWWSVVFVRYKHGPIQDVLGPFMTWRTVMPFAIVNALEEELTFRGIFLTAMCKGGWSDIVGAAVLSAYFALLHLYGGFPSGACGFILVALWSFALCILRIWTNSMLGVMIIHIVADLTIGILVIVAENYICEGGGSREKRRTKKKY